MHGYIGLRKVREAAVANTNYATVLLEKLTIRPADLEAAKLALDSGSEHKSVGSVDMAYTLFAVGTYFSKIPTSSISNRVKALVEARRSVMEAILLFREHGEVISINSVSELGRIEIDLFGALSASRRSLSRTSTICPQRSKIESSKGRIPSSG